MLVPCATRKDAAAPYPRSFPGSLLARASRLPNTQPTQAGTSDTRCCLRVVKHIATPHLPHANTPRVCRMHRGELATPERGTGVQTARLASHHTPQQGLTRTLPPLLLSVCNIPVAHAATDQPHHAPGAPRRTAQSAHLLRRQCACATAQHTTPHHPTQQHSHTATQQQKHSHTHMRATARPATAAVT
jgi:hypothetical protein